jgi:hypothetical protein
VKRDLDLIRRILLAAESAEDFSLTCAQLATDAEPERVVARHVYLLQEAGMLQANLLSSHHVGGAQSGSIDRLTWAGHEFLDAARNDKVWAKAKRTVFEQLGGAPFEVIKALLISYASARLGLTAG